MTGSAPSVIKPVTVGVLHRVAELADRPDGYRPDGAADFNNLVPLAEIISEILSAGPKSKSVNAVIDRLVTAFGPELAILRDVPFLAAIDPALLGRVVPVRRPQPDRQLRLL